VLVPPDAVKTTVSPPVLRLFPAASFACSVRVAGFPEMTLPVDVVIRDVAAETGPTVTTIAGCAVVTAFPPMVEPIVVAVPASTPVKVAV